MKSRIVSVFLALILCLGLTPASGLAADLPAYYNGRDLGYVTPVKTQGFGDCWAHAVISCIESYMLRHRMTDPDTGLPADPATLNLSEYHLAWSAYSDASDEMGMLAGERTRLTDTSDFNHIFLNVGCTYYKACFPLMRWQGPASENVPALAYENVSYDGFDSSYSYQYDVVHLTDCFSVSGFDREAVKRAIMEYGAGGMNIRDSKGCTNDNGAVYCSEEWVKQNPSSSNHAVSVVGWDDHYSRLNFREDLRPDQDGAWIVKNSRGPEMGTDGYFFVSYEDRISAICGICFFAVGPVDEFDHNYQYDGTLSSGTYPQYPNGSAVANVFTAGGRERLDAVSVDTSFPDMDYTLKIYTDLADPSAPSSGTLSASQTGSLPYTGYQTVRLEKPVPLSAGQTFAVVFQLSSVRLSHMDCASVLFDVSGETEVEAWTHITRPASFYQPAGETAWYPANGGNGNYRIKAYTSDYTPVEERTFARLTCSVPGSVPLKPGSGESVSAVRLLSGQLPPGMGIQETGGVWELAGTPTQWGAYAPVFSIVTQSGQVIWHRADLVVAADEPVIRSSAVSAALGSPVSIPVCQRLPEGIFSVTESSPVRCGGVALHLDGENVPRLTGTPSQTGPWPGQYDLLFPNGRRVLQDLVLVVYDPSEPLELQPVYLLNGPLDLSASSYSLHLSRTLTALEESGVIRSAADGGTARDYDLNRDGSMDLRIAQDADGYTISLLPGHSLPGDLNLSLPPGALSALEGRTDFAKVLAVFIPEEEAVTPSPTEEEALPFTDVPESAWYYNDVRLAYRTGLVNGKTATAYQPDDPMTCAEAVKLAACMHQKYTTGSVTLTSGDPWYRSYADYARDNGIISRDYPWNTNISRADYVEIFARALPEEAFSPRNSIGDDSIPDVKLSHPQAASIYKLYRAGILLGSDEAGTFRPDSSIRRSEVAAILTRMMNPDARGDLTLP